MSTTSVATVPTPRRQPLRGARLVRSELDAAQRVHQCNRPFEPGIADGEAAAGVRRIHRTRPFVQRPGRPGEALPSQPNLARRYGLNQTSISRAIAILEAEGLVRTEHGRGSYVVGLPLVERVRHIPPRGAGSGSSFAESMVKSGLTPRTELVRCEVVEPPVGAFTGGSPPVATG